ncbi:MAG: GntR family transcriptional regulator [Treponema sp.]|jgi:DNA-binding GntR family transcriptional regulator|nr:GntR family transcriptional regulator [Treponema sp.]
MTDFTPSAAQQQDNVKSIYTVLKREILSLTIPPGTVISETEICKRFSVSRTPVRSVFQRLSDMRLIKIVPYRETKVALINLHQIKQMIYMRIAIESKVVRDFIDLGDVLLMEKLRYLLRKQMVLLDTDCTPQNFFNEDSAFHRIWFSAMDMDFLWRKIQHAQIHYTRFRMLDMVGVRNFSAIVKEHEGLFSIIENKKKDEVEPFFTWHFNGGIRRLGKRIYTEYSDYFENDGNGE